MPELPEVETYVREIQPTLRGRAVTGAQIYWPRTIAAPSAEDFRREVVGERFADFGRRGKYMLLGLESGRTLIVHLRMTGELRVHSAQGDVAVGNVAENDVAGGEADLPERDKHTHVILTLDDERELRYRDVRKFGRMWLVDEVASALPKLGPEPLSAAFTAAAFGEALGRRKAAAKALLLDQSLVAGVGNIYADEALFRARLHPLRPGHSLTPAEVVALREAVRAVLARGIELRGSSLGSSTLNYAPPNGVAGGYQLEHQVFRRTGEPCPRCATPIERITVAQRSTHFCPACQPLHP